MLIIAPGARQDPERREGGEALVMNGTDQVSLQSFAEEELRREIVGRGLSVLLLSNPCNPTGQLVEGEELKNWVRIARETQCSIVLDEIYSRYIYTQRMSPTDATWRTVSAAQFVEDVDRDPIIILDGLTKCWRMPGLRVCWIVGPKSLIDSVGAAGSFLEPRK
eukprot:s5539_g2.t1